MRSYRYVVVALCLFALPGCGQAGVVQANPGDIAAKLAAARPGDTIKLSPGTYRNLAIVGRRFEPSLEIDAGAAKVVEARLVKTQGVTIRGGVFQVGKGREGRRAGVQEYGSAIWMNDVQDVKVLDATFEGPGDPGSPQQLPFGEGFGVRTLGGRGIEIANSEFDGFGSGMALTRIDGFRLVGNTFAGMRNNGLAVSLSRNGLIEKNRCHSTRIRGDEHPDCIQMWSRPTAPPTSDVIIRGNLIEGDTQGVGLHNHVRKGVDDGGFDRITIENNVINVSRANAINLMNGRNSTIRNNKVSTLPGSKLRARIRYKGDSIKVCGNSVAEGAGRQAQQDPAC